MSRTSRLSPWARAGLNGAGISLFELNGRIPHGWYIGGNAETARGPWHYSLHRGEERYDAACHFVPQIPAAIDGLFEQAGLPTVLEDQLRASLELVR